MKKLLLLLLALLLCVSVCAAEEPAPETFREGLFEYRVTDEGAVLTNWLVDHNTVLPEEVVLPAMLGGYPLVGIDGGAVKYSSPAVVIPEGVRWLQDSSFVSGWEVSRITLPATLEIIPEGCFTLYNVEIILSPGNPYFTNEDGFLIDTRTNTLLHTSPSAANHPLPQVRRLGDGCLYNWHAGEEVFLPETITEIGAGVFSEFMDTTCIHIPAGVTKIENGAFNCAGLTAITLPEGLTSIPPLMLSCTYITEITIPENVKSIGGWAFYLCPLTRVEIPAACEFVAYDAFMPEVEIILLGENTHLETYKEYCQSQGMIPNQT